MEYHLDYELGLITEPEHSSLYKWAITEIGVEKALSRDLIPWPWTLHFSALSCDFLNAIEIERPFALDGRVEPSDIRLTKAIRIALRPGDPADLNRYDSVSYSMMGTKRPISQFMLDVRALADPQEQEICRAWGSVSYTAEHDFRNVTEPDCLWFYLQLKPETFDSYARMVCEGSVDKIQFSIGNVDGFYSDWSPSISTSFIKVLAAGNTQKITRAPADANLDAIPRLGVMGDAHLTFARSLSFSKPPPLPRR